MVLVIEKAREADIPRLLDIKYDVRIFKYMIPLSRHKHES